MHEPNTISVATLSAAIRASALDNQLSERERKEIRLALRATAISTEDLIEQSFELAETMARNEGRCVNQWLRQFVSFIGQARSPMRFLSQGVWFSPGYAIRNVLLNAINSANTNIDLCVFNLTDDQLANALVRAVQRRVQVSIVTELTNQRQPGSDVLWLDNAGANVYLINNVRALMHHKYAVFDDYYVLSGSYNWTRSALLNDENLTLISEPERVRLYVENYRTLVGRCGEPGSSQGTAS